MNDYKELIGKLRHYADTADENIYGLCVNSPEAMVQAADAIEQLVKEQDAAVADLKNCAILSANKCIYCKNHLTDEYGCCFDDEDCGELSQLWEWRGVQE